MVFPLISIKSAQAGLFVELLTIRAKGKPRGAFHLYFYQSPENLNNSSKYLKPARSKANPGMLGGDSQCCVSLWHNSQIASCVSGNMAWECYR